MRPISSASRRWPHGRRRPDQVSKHAKERQRHEMGTLGSGNHYLEIQQVVQVYDQAIGRASASPRAMPQRSTADRAVWATRSAPSFAQHGRSQHRVTASTCPTASWPARRWTRRSARLPRRDAGRDQLRARQPPDHHPSRTRSLRTRVPRSAARSALRRLAQHLQGRAARPRRRSAGSVRAPQGRNAFIRTRSSGPAGRPPRRGATGARRRLDGHGIVCPRRHGQQRSPVVQLVMPRRWPRNEPPPGETQNSRSGGS
jgi:hypothetical protein